MTLPKAAVPAPTPGAFPALPEQTSQRTAVIEDGHARTPGLFHGWAVPPAQSAEHRAIDLAGEILAGGEGSRLHRLLVRDRALASSVSAGAGQRRGPDLFRVEAVLVGGAKLAEVERLIEAEIKALATRGPTDAEVARARRRFEAAFLLGLQSRKDRALRLGEHELCFGDASLLPAELPRTLAVTADDIKRAAAQHLGPTRRTLVETTPAGGTPAPAAAAPETPAPARAALPGKGTPARAPKTPKKGAAKPRKKKP